MNGEELFALLGNIDDDFIEEVAEQKEKKILPLKILAMAACLCLCILGLTALKPLSLSLESFDVAEEPAAAEEMPGEKPDVGEVKEMGEDKYVQSSQAILGVDGMDQKETLKMITASPLKEQTMDEDLAVGEGEVLLSSGLTAALNENDDETLYRVVIEVFEKGTALAMEDEKVSLEEERLAKEGYTVAIESYFDGNVTKHYFTLHATKDQLIHFPPSPNYGYYISLYDDYLGISSPDLQVMN